MRRQHAAVAVEQGESGRAALAVGGAFLTLSAFSSFFFEMVNGRGWICIALVVFGAWKPGKAVLGAILFAAFDALQIRLQQTPLGAALPYQLFLALPFILSILALILMSAVFLLVGFWYIGFVTRHCSRVEAQRMGAMMALIFAALVFYMLYEQTYGSWVTFTDRMLTKDIIPSLVAAQAQPDWSGGFFSDLQAFLVSAPLSIVSLLLAPLVGWRWALGVYVYCASC